ncbi:MAG: hypothetical protein ACK4ND_19135, partial [Cytophagaceae bacterium]
ENDLDSTGNVQQEHEIVYDLSELQHYAMGDEETLKEILEDLIVENKKELDLCASDLKNTDYIALGERIHKLASRFRQIKVKAPIDDKALEKELLSNQLPNKELLEKLIKYWQKVNNLLDENIKSGNKLHV